MKDQGIIRLKTTTTPLALSVSVAYRTPQPDEETVEEVLK
jgi:hypothetical protein